jgi:hypothetical protein
MFLKDIEQFINNTHEVGEQLARLEARKYGISNGPEVDVSENIRKVGEPLGLGADTQIRSKIYGTNQAVGEINKQVDGARI